VETEYISLHFCMLATMPTISVPSIIVVLFADINNSVTSRTVYDVL